MAFRWLSLKNNFDARRNFSDRSGVGAPSPRGHPTTRECKFFAFLIGVEA